MNLTSITGWLAGAKFWLIALAITAVVAGGIGYFKGTDVCTSNMAAELTNARAEAAKAQADRDALDMQHTKADYERRLAAATRRDTAAEVIYRDRKILVPHQEACKVSPQAMHKLNDPDLLAGAQ